MKLSDGEKLILFMLCEIYEKQKVDGDIDPEFVKNAILDDQPWALAFKHPSIFQGSKTPENVEDVLNIMSMWNVIETTFKRLSPADKAKVVKEADLHGDEPKFPGFDGHEQNGYLFIAEFLVKKLDRFSEIKNRDLDSHSPVMEIHKRMQRKYKAILQNPTGNDFCTDDLIAVLKERIHPDHRK